jgi:hypothetical protein
VATGGTDNAIRTTFAAGKIRLAPARIIQARTLANNLAVESRSGTVAFQLVAHQQTRFATASAILQWWAVDSILWSSESDCIKAVAVLELKSVFWCTTHLSEANVRAIRPLNHILILLTLGNF